MNIRPNFYTGIGLGMMVASVILGLIHISESSMNKQQITVLGTEVHVLQNNNQKLRQQLNVMQQEASAVQKNTMINKAINKSTRIIKNKGKISRVNQSKKSGQFVTVVIYPGMSIASIALLLTKSGIIPAPEPFIISAINYNRPLRAGKFTFQVNEPYAKILYVMATN